MGGMLRAVESGFVQREIQEAAFQAQRALESKAQIVVGVNEFADTQGAPVPVFSVDEARADAQRRQLEALRAGRDGARVRDALEALARAAAGTGNLVPVILDAVRAYATIGEICDALRGVFGVHQERVVL